MAERDVDSERQAGDEAGADVDGGEGRGLGEVDGGGQRARVQLDHQRDGGGDHRDGGQVEFQCDLYVSPQLCRVSKKLFIL